MTVRKSSVPAVDRKWRARCDADTLRQAEEIRRDTSRLRAAKSHLRTEVKAAEKVIKGK